MERESAVENSSTCRFPIFTPKTAKCQGSPKHGQSPWHTAVTPEVTKCPPCGAPRLTRLTRIEATLPGIW